MADGLLNNVNDSTKVFSAFLTLGLVGLLFLIVFGNLSGNLGFQSAGQLFTNESITDLNGTAYVLAGFTTVGYETFTVSEVWNQTIPQQLIAAGNFTLDTALGTINGTGSGGAGSNYSNVTVTYTVTHTTNSERSTEDVITNLTGGAVTFFTFSNVWFTLLAVVLLIVIVMGVIVVANRLSGGGSKFSN